MAEFMHQVVMKATRAVVQITHYVVFNCDEVSTIDNQSWLSIHCYVVENWVRIPILISLDRVVTTLQVHGSENIIKVFMEALITDGGLQQN
jgi:hypothetical protein